MPNVICHACPTKTTKELTRGLALWPKILDPTEQYPRPHGAVKLKGQKASYRIRIGPWRVIYFVDDAQGIVVIARVRRRDKDTYHSS